MRLSGASPTKLEKTIDNVAYTTQYAYDTMGRVTGTLYPDGEAVNYSYDAAGNLSAVAGYVAFSDYNALGQPRQITYQNGVVTSRNYNAANNRLTGITTTSPGGEVLLGLGYSYDRNGNIVGITDNVQSNNDQTFGYDGLNRLISATCPSYPADIIIQYDQVGNISLNFDSGKAVNRAGQARAYDEDNRLVGVDAGSTSTFVYDYQGARVKKTSGTSETIYVGKHFQITDGVPTKHIFAGGMRIATKDASSVYYYHADHLGSLRVATDVAGARVQTVNYYPFGEIRDNSGIVDLPYKFTGQEYDPETGLYYYGARFYDPALGRFITPDSIVQAPEDPQSLNRYAYCRNNPLAYTDPTGHFPFFVLFAFAAIGAGAYAAATHQNIGLAMMTPLVGPFIAGACFGGNMGQIALVTVTTAGVFYVAGSLAPILSTATGMGLQVSSTLTHFAAGMASGAISAAASRGNILNSALTGGISAGGAEALGGVLRGSKWFRDLDPGMRSAVGLVSHAGLGSLTGGIAAEITGGKFASGAARGAMIGAFGHIFNHDLHGGELAELDSEFPSVVDPSMVDPSAYKPGQDLIEIELRAAYRNFLERELPLWKSLLTNLADNLLGIYGARMGIEIPQISIPPNTKDNST